MGHKKHKPYAVTIDCTKCGDKHTGKVRDKQVDAVMMRSLCPGCGGKGWLPRKAKSKTAKRRQKRARA